MKNNKSRQKLFIKIFSVFAAVILWFFVTQAEDKLMDVNINSVEVQFVGEHALTEKGLMVVGKNSTPKASVKIRGRRSDLISVMRGITAKVNLSEIDKTGTHELVPDFDIPSTAVYISKVNTLSIEVNVEKIVEKTIDVIVFQEGNEGERIIESVPEFEQMVIQGEKNDIDAIKKARLYVDVSDLTNGNEVVVNPVYETEDGEEYVAVNEIITDTHEIKVRNNVYMRKNADVIVDVPTDEDYIITLNKQSIEQVDVGVTDESQQIDSLIAEFDDITFELGSQKHKLDIIVPDGVYLPKKDSTVEVEIEIVKKSQKVLLVPITVKNGEDKDYKLCVQHVLIKASGPAELLAVKNIRAEIDLKDIEDTATTTRVKVKVTPKNDKIQVPDNATYVEVTVE